MGVVTGSSPVTRNFSYTDFVLWTRRATGPDTSNVVIANESQIREFLVIETVFVKK